MNIDKEINPRFENFIFDWDYKTYLLVGGYGSSKSYHIACKIIFKCLEERRKVLVVREVYETIRDSCYDLFCEILDDLDLLTDRPSKKRVQATVSPMSLRFPNGSKIIFKGMDKPEKLKSINGVSIVWLEEASEIKYSGYKELRGRLRHPTDSLHFILSLNPVDTDNWVYQHFFKRRNENGKEVVILDDMKLYLKRTVVHNGVYYHHSLPDDNLFLPKSYIKELDEMKEYDADLWRVARLGQFGSNGRKVLPQFTVAKSHQEVIDNVRQIPQEFRFCGMDFGFEESYNAVINMAVDDKEKILYIYKEYYKNNMTDDETAKELEQLGYMKYKIVADNEDPKAIRFYQKSGFQMRKCKKFAGSRLANTRKIKRFKKIICSPECVNTIRELKNLVYKKDKNDNIIYDEFNIDPHTFSAIWYGLDTYDVADVKFRARNSRKGEAA